MLRNNYPDSSLLCRWGSCVEDHGLGMLVLQGALWLWGTADILGDVVTVGPDGVRANALLAFFPNISPGAFLSLWCHSPSALPVFVGCDLLPLSIVFVWQHKPTPSTCPGATCQSPDTSAIPWHLTHPLPHLLCVFVTSSCSGWRKGFGGWTRAGDPSTE